MLLLPGTAGHLRGQGYTWTTIAGTVGVAGTNDGLNTTARFNDPSGLTLDRQGNLYVSDTLNGTIRKVSPVGTNWAVSTLAGKPGVLASADGTNTTAFFNRPNGIVVADAGNLFVTDHYGDTIRKVSSAGSDWIVTTLAGATGVNGSADGIGTNAQFHLPTGLALATNGSLFVADTINHTIREVAPASDQWDVSTAAGFADIYGGFADGLDGNAAFNGPMWVVQGPSGFLYVTDYFNHALRQMALSGAQWMVTTIAGFQGVAGNTDGPASQAQFYFPNGIASDSAGNLFVSAQGSHTIRKLVPSGNSWTVSTIGGYPGISGSADGFGRNARFNRPWGLVVDSAGAVYVADSLNHTIRRGVPPVIPAPTLLIALAGEQVVLSWPVSSVSYVLETSSTLGAAAWATLPNTAVTNGNNLVLTNAPGSSTTFYRLRSP